MFNFRFVPFNSKIEANPSNGITVQVARIHGLGSLRQVAALVHKETPKTVILTIMSAQSQQISEIVQTLVRKLLILTAMMRKLNLSASDASTISVAQWWPPSPRAVVQILHGLGEHYGRYDRLAAALNQNGFAVVSHNHRGHGERAKANGELGRFGDGGWSQISADVQRVNEYCREHNPSLPVVLLGHSMGSFVAQSVIGQQPALADMLVLSGSNLANPGELKIARLLARFEAWRQGAQAHSKLLDRLSFGAYHKRFKPTRTVYDWLSRDPVEVDAYIADPLCGTEPSNELWCDLLEGLVSISNKTFFSDIPPELPVLIFGGSEDPVGGRKGLTRLADAYREAGLKDLTVTIYPGGRHEMFNESNRDQVTDDLTNWLTERTT